MPAEAPIKIYDIAAQQAEIRHTVTPRKYQNFVKRHFYETVKMPWLTICREELAAHPEWAGNPAHHQGMALGADVAAQFGFPQLEGQLTRYGTHGWSQESPISPRHQLAVAIYTAAHNLNSFEIKGNIIRELNDPQLEPGVWGLYFAPGENGLEYPAHIDDARRLAEERLTHKLPICLPDIELNRKLAAIQFTGDQADRMPQDEFERDILPEVKAIAQDLKLSNPTTLFVPNRDR